MISLFLLACVDPQAGPDSPFAEEVHPRNPDHFQVFEVPYEVARDLAVATGTPGMADFQFEDWLRPSGSVSVVQGAEGETQFDLQLEGLVPGGFYTAWLVRVAGSSRGDKRDLALGVPYGGSRNAPDGRNALLADPEGNAHHLVSLAADHQDAVGSQYNSIEDWDEIHVAYHADNRAWGDGPGPNHFTQVVVPIRPLSGSAHVGFEAAPTEPTALLHALDPPYTLQDFRAATGELTLDHVDYQTSSTLHVLLTADGLAPGVRYTAWWVDGAADCAIAPLFSDGAGRGSLQAVVAESSPCEDGVFEGIERWSRVELRLDPELGGAAPAVQLAVEVPEYARPSGRP